MTAMGSDRACSARSRRAWRSAASSASRLGGSLAMRSRKSLMIRGVPRRSAKRRSTSSSESCSMRSTASIGSGSAGADDPPGDSSSRTVRTRKSTIASTVGWSNTSVAGSAPSRPRSTLSTLRSSTAINESRPISFRGRRVSSGSCPSSARTRATRAATWLARRGRRRGASASARRWRKAGSGTPCAGTGEAPAESASSEGRRRPSKRARKRGQSTATAAICG